MKNTGFIILLIVVTCIVSYFSFHSGKNEGTGLSRKQYKSIIDAADKVIDSLKIDNIRISNAYDSVNIRIKSFNRRDSLLHLAYVDNEKKLKDIQNKYAELRRFNNLTVNEVKQYFNLNFSDSTH